MYIQMEPQPNCAICNTPQGPPNPECNCESERLQIAVQQAQDRAMGGKLAEIRDWVINNARHHILQAFQRLTGHRKAAHLAYLSSLPYYSVYMQYQGQPPLHPAALAQLQHQIAEAHAELKRGIDADWRASVLRYPEVLDYFYSLVELRVPSEKSSSVTEPPFAVAGYSDRGYERSNGIGKESKKKRRDKGDRDSSEPPDRMARNSRGYDSFPTNRMIKAPPTVPTPPIASPVGHRRRSGSFYGGY